MVLDYQSIPVHRHRLPSDLKRRRCATLTRYFTALCRWHRIARSALRMRPMPTHRV